MRPSKNKLLLIAGSFAIIAACICAFLGMISLNLAIKPPPYTPLPGQPMTPPSNPYSLLTVLGLLGFAGGLAGGILTLKRKMFNRAMAGIALMIFEGIAFHVLFFYPATAWILGTPVILLAVLSIFFAAMSRREFTS